MDGTQKLAWSSGLPKGGPDIFLRGHRLSLHPIGCCWAHRLLATRGFDDDGGAGLGVRARIMVSERNAQATTDVRQLGGINAPGLSRQLHGAFKGELGRRKSRCPAASAQDR